jgi:hypothetical protein
MAVDSQKRRNFSKWGNLRRMIRNHKTGMIEKRMMWLMKGEKRRQQQI